MRGPKPDREEGGDGVDGSEVSLSLEEILKPFAGLSQLLGAAHEFKTIEDLNNMISKAADEFEAMREDKLNDGRPLGPLQVRSPSFPPSRSHTNITLPLTSQGLLILAQILSYFTHQSTACR